jgi:Cu-processing system permease protein
MNCAAILIIASQETRINIRNRWTLLFATVFGLLTLVISYFGMVTEGYAGFQGFERTTASLLSLVLYLAPLVALTMATLSFTGDRGAAELLFSQPVARSEILLGKFLGLFGSVLTAMLIGFGLAGTMIALQVGTEGLLRFLSFTGIAVLLALAFLSLGSLLAVFGVTRARAFGLALFVWFFLVVFYDLLVIGACFLVKERTANLLIFLSLFGNPVDVARISALLSLGDATIFGAAGAALVKFLGGRGLSKAALLIILVAWTVGPISLANRVLCKKDL